MSQARRELFGVVPRSARRLFRSFVLLVFVTGTLAGIGVAFASTGSPVKGGIYEGAIGTTNSPGGPAQETLTVSRNGREVASVVVLPVECGQPGGPIATVRNIKIVHGSFTAAYPRTATASGTFNDATLTGHFLSHGRVSGVEKIRSNETINGSLCKYSLPLTATAEPAGTKRCPNHSHGGHAFSDILATGTTCSAVNKAADNGTFTQPGGPTSVPQFATPGWKCRVLTSGVNNHECSRTHPKAMFSFSTVA